MPIRVFPVDAAPKYVDDFGYIKPDGRVHQGIDIHAPRGSPLVAVDDGVITNATNPRGGYSLNLKATDATRYYYAHADAFEGELPRQVNAGDVIAYLGTTGNAQGTDPHLHFEKHPNGGAAVDPYAELKATEGLPKPLPPTKLPAQSTALPWLVGAGVIAVLAGGVALAYRR